MSLRPSSSPEGQSLALDTSSFLQALATHLYSNQITQEFKAGQAKQACLKECIQTKKDHGEFVEGELWSRLIVLVTSQFISSKDPAKHLLRIVGSEKQAVKKALHPQAHSSKT